MRAREADRTGYAVRSGVRLYYEVHGCGPTTVLLLPTWSIAHSRIWKLQVPFLARHAQVVVYDPRGNGRSDRPASPSAYDDAELVADAVAVLEAVGVQAGDRRRSVDRSPGPARLAADHPARVAAPSSSVPHVDARRTAGPVEPAFEDERDEL